MKAEIKTSPSMGYTAGPVGMQCRNEFPTGLSGTNHPVPLQVLGYSKYSGSYEPKPFTLFLLLF